MHVYNIHVFVGVITQRAGVFGEGFGRVHLDNLACNGSENRLQDCPHSVFEEVSCQNFESDVGVICPGMYMYSTCMHVHVPALMKRPGIGRNTSCTCIGQLVNI